MIAPGAAAPPALGALRDRVQLRRRDAVSDEAGGHVITFVPIATVWARVRALSPRSIQTADGRAAQVTYAVVLRYRDDIKAGDRLVFQGRALDVIGADDLNEQRIYLSCQCSETSFTG